MGKAGLGERHGLFEWLLLTNMVWVGGNEEESGLGFPPQHLRALWKGRFECYRLTKVGTVEEERYIGDTCMG